MVYDDSSDRIILFGDKHNDMWSYDYNLDIWEELAPGKMPLPRIYCDMVYDTESDLIILFGGVSIPDETALQDTLAYRFETNTWTQLDPDMHPSARGWYAAVYSGQGERLILFGGGENRWTFTDETWIYDSEANIWTNITPSR
jgi:hypothetical protein